jgi:hypothetical protein
VLEQAAGIANNIAKLELDGLKMGLNALAAGSLQCAEQLVAARDISLICAHSHSSKLTSEASAEHALKFVRLGRASVKRLPWRPCIGRMRSLPILVCAKLTTPPHACR